jgi:capsular polysaccharide transport system permease protein
MKYEGSAGFQAGVRVDPAKRTGVGASWTRRIPPMFTIMVVIPTLLGVIYYGLIATPMYESEAQFVVRQKTEVAAPSAAGPSFLSSMGIGGADQGRAQEVVQFLKSRDAVAQLEQGHDLRAMLARPGSDFLSRFPRPFEGVTFENLYYGFQRFITVGTNAETQISTLRVRAYRAKDAQALTTALLESGEALVNKMNARSLADSVGQAKRQVADAETAAANAQTALTVFRNRQQIVDPQVATQTGAQLLLGLESQLASLKAQRAGLAASAPQSPQLPVMDRNIAAFQAQIDEQNARATGQANSLAPKVSEFERLSLDQDIAAKALAEAEGALEAAELDATRNQLYLEPVVSPNLPDKAEQPQRLRSIATIVISALVAYAAVSLLVAGLREHRQE